MEIGGCNRHFVVAKDAHGHWIARETLERHIQGVFRTRREAIRFALIETTRVSLPANGPALPKARRSRRAPVRENADVAD
jgi:hypothetical protein